jgi:hypothetical protein
MAISCMCTLQFICTVQQTTSATQNKLHWICGSHGNNYGLDTGKGKPEFRPPVLSILCQYLIYNSIQNIHHNLSDYAAHSRRHEDKLNLFAACLMP